MHYCHMCFYSCSTSLGSHMFHWWFVLLHSLFLFITLLLCCFPSDATLDLREPYSSSVFPGCVSHMERGLGRGGGSWRERGRGRERGREGYGALSDTPSIITLPPALSPPPSTSTFSSLSLSPPSPLKTISAQDLEKSFLWVIRAVAISRAVIHDLSVTYFNQQDLVINTSS